MQGINGNNNKNKKKEIELRRENKEKRITPHRFPTLGFEH